MARIGGDGSLWGRSFLREMTPPIANRGPEQATRSAGPSSAGQQGRPGAAPPVRVTLLLFAAAREAAGGSRWELDAVAVADLLDQARRRFGAAFGAVLDRSRVWLNGEPVSGPEPLRAGDEVAVLPPVSGG